MTLVFGKWPIVTVPFGRAARWLSRNPTVVRLSRWLPRPLRVRLRDRANDLARRAAVYALPVHLDLPDAAKRPEPHFRVVVFGAFLSDWNAPLIDPLTWQGVPGVVEVVRVLDAAQIATLPATRADTIVIPLGEDHIRSCPSDRRSLIPDSHALETTGDKALFAKYMDGEKLSALCPTTYRTLDEVVFPCMLKRLDQNGGYGIEIVASREQLGAFLKTDVFAEQEYIVQEFIPGDTQYTFHCVCKDGEILWSYTLASETGGATQIGLNPTTATPVTPSPRTVSQLATILARLRFSGPCCANYKILPSGDIALFEINPRFGGSLMLATDRSALRQALSCVITNAR